MIDFLFRKNMKGLRCYGEIKKRKDSLIVTYMYMGEDIPIHLLHLFGSYFLC